MTEQNQPTKREQAIIYTKLIIEPLCKFPEQITIEDIIDERGLMLTINANDKDLPFLIGRGGEIAQSLRNIMNIWGLRNIAKVNIMIKK